MANSKLSFAIAVKLMADNFKSGATTVKTQLRSMQMQAMSFVAAMGAGTIGLSNFISKLVETAKETSRVNIALKNVSGTTEAYLENQKWLIDISKKYGVDINSLTSGYAKFKAAADASNMSLFDQRKIFESVSRASVAFGLSAEDQKGVFLALSQMIGKSKVSAEELRTQMAERLPVAIQAMAKAARVEIKDLYKLMEQGKILSAEVLPGFADALNEMIPNVDTNNLNKSLSDLGNTFVEFTKNLNVEDKFKWMVDKATHFLGVLANNVKWVFGGIQAILFFTFGSAIKGAIGSMLSRYDGAVAAAVKATERITKTREQTQKAQEALNAASVAHNAASEREKALSVEASETQKRQARQATHSAEATLKKKERALTSATEAQKRAEASVTAKTQEMAAKKGQTGWARFGSASRLAINKVTASIKAMAASLALTGIISAITAIIVKLSMAIMNAINEAARIKNIAREANREANKPINDGSIDRLTAYQKILNNTKSADNERKGALYEINGLLGTQYEFSKLYTGEQGKQKKNLDDLNQRIADQIRLISLRNRAAQLQTIVDTAKDKIQELKDDPNYGQRGYGDETRNPWGVAFDRFLARGLFAGPLKNEVEQHQKVVDTHSPEIEHLTKEIADILGKIDPGKTTETDPDPDPDDKKKKTELQKQEESYGKSLRGLQVQLDLGLITQAEFNDAKRDLVEKMYVEAKASDDKDIPNSDYYKMLTSEYGKSAHGEVLKAEQEYASIMREYTEGAEVQRRLFTAGMQTQKEYQSALYDLGRELKRQLVSKSLPMKGVLPAVVNASTKMNAPKPDLKVYDNSRDYKKTDRDILAGQLDVAEENLDKIQTLYEENASLFANQLNDAMGNVKSLEEALRVAEVMEDVQNLSKAIKTGLYEGTKNIVSNVDGIVSSFERVGDVLKDSDASAWEKMMAVWQAMISIGDAISATAGFIENMANAKERLAMAENAQATASSKATAENVANIATNIAADATETTSVVANAGTQIGAAEGTAMANAAASASIIPFPFNLIAMSAVTAGVSALFSKIPKFANGGIVGGSSPSGDKILARLNSGEMILNQGQQGTLYDLLDSGGGVPQNINVTGTFRMRGRDMMAVIDKENRIKDRT